MMGETTEVLSSNGRRRMTVPTYVVVRGYDSAGTGTYELSLVDFRERLQSARRISPGTKLKPR